MELEFFRYFVCVDNIPFHFVEGCFVHFNEKINCTLLDGIDERNIYIFFGVMNKAKGHI